MATVQINLCNVTARSRVTDAPLSIVDSVEAAAETVNSTTSSQVATTPGIDGLVWVITALEAVYVAFGATPIAGSGKGHLIPAGGTRSWKVTKAGEKVAYVAAS